MGTVSSASRRLAHRERSPLRSRHRVMPGVSRSVSHTAPLESWQPRTGRKRMAHGVSRGKAMVHDSYLSAEGPSGGAAGAHLEMRFLEIVRVGTFDSCRYDFVCATALRLRSGQAPAFGRAEGIMKRFCFPGQPWARFFRASGAAATQTFGVACSTPPLGQVTACLAAYRSSCRGGSFRGSGLRRRSAR